MAHHEVATAYELGWSTLKNGDLLVAAERADFGVLVTTDLNLRYQQNLGARRIALVVISTPSWPRIRKAVDEIVKAVGAASPGSYVEVQVP